MMDLYKDLYTGDIWTGLSASAGGYDPMVEEAWTACAAAVTRPLSFSPAGSPRETIRQSPVYTPNWDKLAELNEEAAALGCSGVIHFGPGVQQGLGAQAAATAITEQVAEMILEERRNSVVDSLFVPCEQPILGTPVQEQQTKCTGRSKPAKGATVSLRRSTRQMAKVCSVPVSKRATHRLIKAFGMVGSNEPIGEEALAAFAKSFDTPMISAQIEAVRQLTSLDSESIMAASAQMAAAVGAEEMDQVAV